MDNKIYLICYVDKLDKDALMNILNLDANIAIASLVRLKDCDYSIEDFVDYVKNISTKYPWKIHDIVEENYPEPLVMDVILDTAIRKNNSEYIFFFNKLEKCTIEQIKLNNSIIDEKKNKFGAIVDHKDPYSNFVTSFTNFVTLNKNKNNEYLIDKIRSHESMILHEI